MTGFPCTLCARNDRDADFALLTADSIPEMSARLKVSQSTADRHLDHVRIVLGGVEVCDGRAFRTWAKRKRQTLAVSSSLERAMAVAEADAPTKEQIYGRTYLLEGVALQLLEDLRREEDLRGALEATKVAHALVARSAELAGHLGKANAPTVVNVWAHPDVLAASARLLAALAPWPEARVAAAAALSVSDPKAIGAVVDVEAVEE